MVYPLYNNPTYEAITLNYQVYVGEPSVIADLSMKKQYFEIGQQGLGMMFSLMDYIIEIGIVS